MSRTYRVAVYGRTGKGNYGHGLDTCWKAVPETEVVAVCDEDDRGRALAAERLQVERTYSDFRTMFDEVRPDIVAICPRWVDQHRDVAVAAAERGIHIYIEKPFCRTPAEADEIVRACEMTHTKLAVAHPTRYSPKLRTIRRLIREGAIGQVIELQGRGKEDRRGGGEDLWVLGSHVTDMMLALGHTPQWCFATVLQEGEPLKRAHVREGNEGLGPLAGDAVRAEYGLAEGITASFKSYRGTGGEPSRYGLRIFGSRGVIELFEGTMPTVYILQDAGWSTSRSDQGWKTISTTGIDQPESLEGREHTSRHVIAIKDLLDAIENERQPLCNMYEARQGIEMIAAVFESQRVGKPVPFPLETRENPLTLL